MIRPGPHGRHGGTSLTQLISQPRPAPEARDTHLRTKTPVSVASQPGGSLKVPDAPREPVKTHARQAVVASTQVNTDSVSRPELDRKLRPAASEEVTASLSWPGGMDGRTTHVARSPLV
jgi:hypothetical protein